MDLQVNTLRFKNCDLSFSSAWPGVWGVSGLLCRQAAPCPQTGAAHGSWRQQG